jgi:hypothetical protein
MSRPAPGPSTATPRAHCLSPTCVQPQHTCDTWPLLQALSHPGGHVPAASHSAELHYNSCITQTARNSSLAGSRPHHTPSMTCSRATKQATLALLNAHSQQTQFGAVAPAHALGRQLLLCSTFCSREQVPASAGCCCYCEGHRRQPPRTDGGAVMQGSASYVAHNSSSSPCTRVSYSIRMHCPT